MANVIFKIGTKEKYSSLAQKDTNTLYWLTDTQELYKGDILFAVGAKASAAADGLMSAEDKKALDGLLAAEGSGLTAVDKSIVLADSDEGMTIGVNISDVEGNPLKLQADGEHAGLYVDVPEISTYEIVKNEESEGFAAVYTLKKTTGGLITDCGSINIPKDLVVKSGEVKKVETENQPYDGAQVGDPYIDLEVSDGGDTHLYIPVKDLIDTSSYVEKKIQGDLGSAQIINEGDGGCLYFKRTEDGKVSRVSVHDGSGNNVMVQLQGGTITEDNRNDGTTISLFEEMATYRNKANKDKEISDPKLEIATVGDLDGLVKKSISTPETGEALIANDPTGGGVWFRGVDGVESFVGVNDGAMVDGKKTVGAQIYVAAMDGDKRKDGSFINVYQDKITYNNQARMKAGAKNSDASSEIAVVGDIAAYSEKAAALYAPSRFEFVGLLEGSRVDVNGKELRVMFKEGAAFVKPDGDVEGRDNNKYYFGVKFFSPVADVDGFKEDHGETIGPEVKKEKFDGSTSAGIDQYGRPYDICWFPAAECGEEDSWAYYGAKSEAGKCVGWYHTIEWYKGDNCVGSETVRINLTNENCHNSLKEYLGSSNTPSGAIEWETMD